MEYVHTHARAYTLRLPIDAVMYSIVHTAFADVRSSKMCPQQSRMRAVACCLTRLLRVMAQCGLNDWDINSEIVRAVATSPVGPYTMVERVAGPFAHEPNVVEGRIKSSSSSSAGEYMLLGTMNAHTVAPPAGIVNCTRNTHPLSHQSPGYQPPSPQQVRKIPSTFVAP